MNGKDFYKILGIARDATSEDIKRAHRKLARKYHPDLNPGDKAAEERFKEIQEAYDTLSDPDKRVKYDQYGEMWARMPTGGAPGSNGTAGGGFSGSPFVDVDAGNAGLNFEEFLERMFGGGGRGARRGSAETDFSARSAAPAEDVEFSLNVTLEEAYRGAEKRIDVTVEDVCPDCDGTGQKRNSRGQFDLSGGGVCPKCRGRGRIASPRSGKVSIPPGAWDGLRLKLSGQGAADARGRRGDLYVQLRLTPHAKFERDGQDLQFDVAVPYTVAALGGDVAVETLDGQKRQLVVPPGVQSGQRMRLSGQGMPALRDRKAGDAYARVKITVPRDLSDRERKLLGELADIRKDPVRHRSSV